MTKPLAVFADPRVLHHDTGVGFFEMERSPLLPVAEAHPENRTRIENMLAILRNGPLAGAIEWHEAPAASVDAILRFHSVSYFDRLRSLDPSTTHRLTPNTVLGPAGLEIAQVSAGLAIGAVEHAWRGSCKAAYALCRPPGHHAQPEAADGYCFLNNIGIAVRAVQARGARRIAVVDWDVHHGNGTQEGFYEDDSVLTVSVHMDHRSWDDHHPQTGLVDEIGTGSGIGLNLNMPLPFGVGNDTYRCVFDEIVAPAVEDFAPELIVIAAGQDASQFDPNGRQCVTMDGFHELGLRARELADRVCGGRVAAIQEGGYAPSYSAYCLSSTLAGLIDQPAVLQDPLAYLPNLDPDPLALVDRLRMLREAAIRGAG